MQRLAGTNFLKVLYYPATVLKLAVEMLTWLLMTEVIHILRLRQNRITVDFLS